MLHSFLFNGAILDLNDSVKSNILKSYGLKNNLIIPLKLRFEVNLLIKAQGTKTSWNVYFFKLLL